MIATSAANQDRGNGAISRWESTPNRSGGEIYPQLADFIPPDFRREWAALSQERDPELFINGVFQLGRRLEEADQIASAAHLYQWLGASKLKERAQERLALLSGTGPLALRAEFLLKRVAEESTNLATLGAMAGAQWISGASRLSVLTRLLGSPHRVLSHPWLAKGLASAGGLGAEILAFTGLHRGLAALSGTPPEESFAANTGNIFLLLGALRLTGGACSLARLNNRILIHGASLAGIYLASHLSSKLGWAPEQGFDERMADSLALWLQFHASAHLLRSAGGAAWARMNGELRLRENLALSRKGGLGIPLPRLLTPQGINLHMMQGGGEDAPAPPTGPGPLVFSRHSTAAPLPPSRLARIFHLSRNGSVLVIPKNFGAAFDGLPENTRLVEIFSDYMGEEVPLNPNQNGLQELRQEISRALYDSKALSEIRVHLGDGSLLWVARNELGRTHYGYEVAEVGKQIEKARTYSQERIHTLFLLSPHPDDPEQNLWSRVFRLLREGRALSRGEVAEQVNRLSGSAISAYGIGAIENVARNAPQFPRLLALSEIFQVDPSDLIEAINLSRLNAGLLPGIRVADWRTPEYPIYLETSGDLERLQLYRKTDPNRESFGWLIYSRRKNPRRYLFTSNVHERTGIDDHVIAKLERNRPHQLALGSFAKLGALLDIRLEDLLTAYNATQHPKLDLDRLFPEQALYLDPDSRDIEKIQSYQKNPGSLGQLLFAARQSQEGYPSSDKMDGRLGRRRGYWQSREWNQVEVNEKNWRNWVALFSHLGLSLRPLARHLERLGHRLDRPPALLTQALGQESLEEFGKRTGIAPATVSQAMYPKAGKVPAVLKPQTLLNLQDRLPRLRGDWMYLSMHPEIVDFFPGLSFSRPQLFIGPKEMESAARFHIGELFFAERMNRDWLVKDLAHHLGVPQEDINRQETRTVGEIDMGLLHRAKRLMGTDPRIAYLHFRPQILRLFELADPETGETYRLSEEGYQNWLNTRNSFRDPSNGREDLRRAMEARGISGEKGLARFTKMSGREARKFLKSSIALNLEDIQRITSAFREFSYRKWYENSFFPHLAYFLGRNPDGTIDYRLPGSMSLADLERVNPVDLIREKVDDLFPSIRAATDQTGLSYLESWVTLERSMKYRSWNHQTLARTSRELGIDRRILYLWMKLPELRPILEENRGLK